MLTLTTFDATPGRYFVWTPSNGPELTKTATLSLYLSRPGAMVPATWEGFEVVTRDEARRRLASAEGDLYDPWTGTLLPPDEAAAWTSRDLLHAAHWGVSTSPSEWKPGRWSEAADLQHDAATSHPAVARLLQAFARQPESVQAAARERATTAPPVVPETGRKAPTTGKGTDDELLKLIMRTFTVDELRRVVSLYTPEVTGRLPSGPVSQVVFTWEVIEASRRLGVFQNLLRNLAQERPRVPEFQRWL